MVDCAGEDEQNKTLLDLSEQILALTREVRDMAVTARSTGQDQETSGRTDRPT